MPWTLNISVLLEAGMKVVGCARRVENIEELAKEWENLPGKVLIKGINSKYIKGDQTFAIFLGLAWWSGAISW